jgi:hypothetical protein
VLLLEQQGLHVRVGLRAVEYDEAIHHRAPMRSKGDADTNQLKVGGLFQLPRSLTDAGYGSAVAAPGKRPLAFMILKMGRLREIISSSSPGQSPPITVTRRGHGFAIGWTTGSKRAGCGPRQFQVWCSGVFQLSRRRVRRRLNGRR